MIWLETLGGFPAPPATSSGEQSSPPLTRSTWEPWEGSQPLPRRAPASKARLRSRDRRGNPGRVPNPSRDELRRAKLASAHAIDVGTLGGFPTPPATSSGEQSSPPLTRSTWEPWEGSQ